MVGNSSREVDATGGYMAKTLKNALKKSSKNDSSFWDRMAKTVRGSTAFHEMPKHLQDRVLDFFTPEWEDRDGKFFPKLDSFVKSYYEMDDFINEVDLNVVHSAGERTSVNRIANKLGVTFPAAMQLVLNLAAVGVVTRAPPFRDNSDYSVYNVKVARPKLKFLIQALHHRRDWAEAEAFIELFQWELNNAHDKFAISTLVAVHATKRRAKASQVESILNSNPTKSFLPAEMERLLPGDAPRSSITLLLLELCLVNKAKRVEPFYRVNDDGDTIPQLRFQTTVPSEARGLKDQPVELGSLPTKEAKKLLASLAPEATPTPKAASNEDLAGLIKTAVQEAVNAALLDSDRLQMEAIRALLRERKLPTDNPVAVLKAKLSKKRLPRAGA